MNMYGNGGGTVPFQVTEYVIKYMTGSCLPCSQLSIWGCQVRQIYRQQFNLSGNYWDKYEWTCYSIHANVIQDYI